MKILHVIDTLNVGGAERMLVTLSNVLHQKGIDVSVVLIVKSGDLKKELHKDIPVLFLNRTKRFEISKFKQFAKILDGFDIVHAHLKHNFRYTAIAVRWFCKSDTKLVFHDHSHYYGLSKWSLKSLKDISFKFILKPKYYIGVSQGNCAWAVDELKINKTNVFLLENTVPQIGIEEKSKTPSGLVVVANITPIKNIEFAIKLAAALNENLSIYGKVKNQDYFMKLHKLIEVLNLGEKVKFIHDCNNVQSELHNYKTALHSSYQETGPLVLIEYLAQNLPFLSSSTGQVYNILKEELPQNFVDNFSIESWQSKMTQLDGMETADFKTIYKTYFCMDNYGDKCLKIYQKILNS